MAQRILTILAEPLLYLRSRTEQHKKKTPVAPVEILAEDLTQITRLARRSAPRLAQIRTQLAAGEHQC